MGPGSQVPEKGLALLGTRDLRPRVPEKELAPGNLPVFAKGREHQNVGECCGVELLKSKTLSSLSNNKQTTVLKLGQ